MSEFNDSIKYHLTGMYQDWFLDYASYVILERAVPSIEDGLKPVQRRILHAMKCVDDGKKNKVANIVGQTMQYHPHGDASICDALVQLGQKNLLIECQGNWGNILTGDGAAASRYIEARLSKFALETVFNPKTTEWMLSYDGRKKEPIHLPIKFPLLLAQGVEGIAVGLNSKILPHNFCELCDASLAYLKGEDFQLYPDFITGGEIDVSKYNDGERGGTIRIRAKIKKEDENRTLVISEIPYGTTTTKIIETILRANQKGKIKIRKVDDFTAEEARIVVQLAPGSSSDKAIDALYAFTDCEINVSPNCCVIQNKKPIFTNVSNLLKLSTDHTKELLQWELEIQKKELEEQLFFTSLEKIFIEQRIYKESGYENAPNKEKLIDFVDKALDPWKSKLLREVKVEDIERLFDIRMIRITKFDSKKANELMKDLQQKIQNIKHHLSHIVEYTITWFEGLKEKYGAQYPRKTEIRNFASINVKTIVEANEKLYINREEGFIGTGLKKDEFLCNCSDIDDIIIFYKDGRYKVIRVAEKIFIGTNLLHIAIFRKNDTRTIYNVVYRDGKKGIYYMKRFNVTGISRDKEYDLTMGTPGSKVIYFTANPNGEAEVIRIQLKPALHLKKIDVIKDLSELAVKSRSARGNVLTKYEIKSISLKQKGHSTLGGRKVWFDPDVLRVNYDEQGIYLGEFKEEDRILVIRNDGNYYLSTFDLTAHFDTDIFRIEKYNKDKVWSLAMWNAEQKYYYAKRFYLDAQSKTQNLLGTDSNNKIVILTDIENPIFEAKTTDNNKPSIEIIMNDFIEIKSVKAKGKRITTLEVTEIRDITPEPIIEETAEVLSEEIPNEMPVDVPLIIENNIPEDSLPIDEQLSLF
jgi:topoisomerase-4 subunit A